MRLLLNDVAQRSGRNSKRAASAALALACTAGVAAPVWAADWVGPTGGSWSTPANWSGGAVPVVGEGVGIGASDVSQGSWHESVIYDGSYGSPGLGTLTLSAFRAISGSIFNGPSLSFTQNLPASQLVVDTMTLSVGGVSSTSNATLNATMSAGTTSVAHTFRLGPSPSLGTGSFGQYNLTYGLSGTGALSVGDDLWLGNTNLNITFTQGSASTNVVGHDLRVSCTPGASGSAVYTLAGGTLTVNGAIVVEGTGARFEQTGGTLNAATLNMAGGRARFAGQTISFDSYTVSGGTLEAAVVRSPGQMSVSSGRTMILGTLVNSGSLPIDAAGGASLDLNDNDAIFTSTGPDAATIRSYIATARHGGAWDRGGLTSLAAKNQPQHATGLGLLSGAELNSVGGTGTFSGQPYAPSDTLVKYTWNGDANFDGRVTFDDYVKIDTGFNTALTGWLNGDFNYSGNVSFDDYVLIDVAFNQQNGTLGRAIDWINGEDRSPAATSDPAVDIVLAHFDRFGSGYGTAFLAAVPEPAVAGVALGALSMTAAAHRRRRMTRISRSNLGS